MIFNDLIRRTHPGSDPGKQLILRDIQGVLSRWAGLDSIAFISGCIIASAASAPAAVSSPPATCARDRPDLLVADHALPVDHEGLGHAVDAEIDAHPALGIGDAQHVGIAELLEPRLAGVRLVLVVEPDERNDAALRELHEQRMLVAARRAPRRPHVEEPHLALHVLLREREIRLVQLRSWNAGTGRSMSGDGTSRGFSVSPTASSATSSTKTPRGTQVSHVGRAARDQRGTRRPRRRAAARAR